MTNTPIVYFPGFDQVLGIRQTDGALVLQGGTILSPSELGSIDALTAGTVSASKAIIVDDELQLTWPATTADTSGAVSSLDISLTSTGPGSSLNGVQMTTTVNGVAAGTWANGANSKLDLSAAGSKVTGLGGAHCAELDLGAGCADGTYTCFEGELILGTGALTGTETSFGRWTVSGDDAATFDTNGFLLSLQGLSAGDGSLFQTGNTLANAVATLKCKVGATTYYLPLYDGQITTA